MKTIEIFGGGTYSYVRNHLALCAPAFGRTAKNLSDLFHNEVQGKMMVNLHLTRMVIPYSTLITNEDVKQRLDEVIKNLNTKIDITKVNANTTNSYDKLRVPQQS